LEQDTISVLPEIKRFSPMEILLPVVISVDKKGLSTIAPALECGIYSWSVVL